jgi:hypothetical protein
MKRQARRFLSLGFVATALSRGAGRFSGRGAGSSDGAGTDREDQQRGVARRVRIQVFAAGERIDVSFRIGSASTSHASASIFDHTTDGRLVILSFGTVSTNQWFTFAARVAGPAGR